jgi:DNA-binding beta-propeller fold protein YncE
VSFLVTSAGGVNGDGYGAILRFDDRGDLLGRFTHEPLVVDPRGMTLDPSGTLLYVNSGLDRVVVLNLDGELVRESGPIPGLDPGGAYFGPDGRFYLTARRRRTVLALPPSLEGPLEPVLPDRVVPFPRGFAAAGNGRLFLASGVGPSGEGDNTILVLDRDGRVTTPRLVADPDLSPLDLMLTGSGDIVVASEHPFGDPEARATLREYDSTTGALTRVFAPDVSVGFSKPRGVRLASDGRLYCIGEKHLVAFEFDSGESLGAVLELSRLHGQAVVVLRDHPKGACVRRA